MSTNTYAQDALATLELPEGWVKFDDDFYEGPYAEHTYGARLYTNNWNDGSIRLIDRDGTDQGEFDSLESALEWLHDDEQEG